ncbi:MAG: TonB-dependent receptor, partial [Deltaproteobacteria bacterium]
MNKFVATLLLAAFALAGYAQNMVKGKVADAETGEPLIGASVMVKGTDQGTVTDLDGMFELRLDNGAYTLVISYTGYETTEVPVNVKGETDLGTIEVGFGAVGLSEVEVIASVAIDRRTPVAVTSLKGDYIAEVVGNQEFPEVLRKTPSVYVTKQGGGFGDSRINVRGFDQRNTAVMINGVPVNDMENGWVYWSNWAGLSDVTSRIDYQRG